MSVEARIVARLVERFTALCDAGRCVLGREVRVLTWGHIERGAQTVRPDMVVSLDDGPLCAIEVKGRLEKPADLGRALSQCDDYARSRVAANDAAKVPVSWMGRPVWGAFLAFDLPGSEEAVRQHAAMAPRIVGPRNVGLLSSDHCGLTLHMGGERYWSEARGWRADAFARGVRIGSSRAGAP